MKIGILGAGNIGGNLGRRFAEKGHAVRFGSRRPDELAELVAACGPGAAAVAPREAAEFGEVVVLAVPWAAVPSVLDAAGDLAGKVLIDATNAIRWSDGPELAASPSAAEEIARLRPGARVVKGFNTLGAEHLLDPTVAGQPADVFLASDDDRARETARALAEEIGFVAVDLGPLRNARLVESLALAWIHLAMRGGLGRNIAFKVLRGQD